MGPRVFTEQPVFRLFLFPFSVSLPPSRGLFPISRLAVSRLRKNRDTLLSVPRRHGGGGSGVIINAPPFKRGNFFTRVEKEKKKKPRKLFDSIRFDVLRNATSLLLARVKNRRRRGWTQDGRREMVVHHHLLTTGDGAAMPSGNFRPRIEMLLR